MQIYKYSTQEDYDRIVAEKAAQGFILTHVSNITEGNYLGFKEPEEIKPTLDAELKTLKEKLDTVLANQTEVVQLKAEKEILLQEIAAKDIIISEKELLLQVKDVELQELKAVDEGILQKG